MKKFIKTLAATLATVMVFGMTVSAAGSPDGYSANPINASNAEDTQAMSKAGATKAFDAAGNQVELKFVASNKEDQAAAEKVAAEKKLGKVVVAFEMTATGNGPYTVTLKVPGLKNDTAYSVMHYTNGAWEVIAAKNNNDGTITFTVNSCSPFAVVEGVASAAVVAPKTGEVIAMAAILALVMMAGAVVCAKKARLQK